LPPDIISCGRTFSSFGLFSVCSVSSALVLNLLVLIEDVVLSTGTHTCGISTCTHTRTFTWLYSTCLYVGMYEYLNYNVLVAVLPLLHCRFTPDRALLLRPGRGVEYCDQPVCVSLSVCVSVCEHISGTTGPIFTKFVCRSPVAVGRSSSGSVAIQYVLPVLWMTSRLAIVGRRQYVEAAHCSDYREQCGDTRAESDALFMKFRQCTRRVVTLFCIIVSSLTVL